MSTSVNSAINKLIKDAEKKVKADLVDMSSKIHKDFTKTAQDVVNLYYAHYTPKIYERTGNLKKNVIDDSLSFMVLNGHGYGAWIQFNSSNMADYDDGTYSADKVVSNFMWGIHGNSKIFSESLPAFELMDDFQENYKKTLDGYFTKLGYTVK